MQITGINSRLNASGNDYENAAWNGAYFQTDPMMIDGKVKLKLCTD